MKEFKLLKFLDKNKKIYTKFGVDYDVMRSILKLKLTMDGRRVPTVFNNNKNNEKKDSNQFKKMIGLYTFLGLIQLSILMIGSNIMFKMSMYFGVLIFMLMTTFISDFSSVILDLRDRNLIATKGVDLRTLNAAKMTHVAYYVLSLTLALCGPALILFIFTQGIIFTLLFFIEIIALDIVIVILTTFVYFLILKFFDGEKLKDIINIIQIFFVITLSIGYQLVGRSFELIDNKIEYVTKWWDYLLIPTWFAAPLSLLKDRNFEANIIILTAMAVIGPIIFFIIYLRLSKSFEIYLQKLNDNSMKKKKDKQSLSFKISKIICRSKEERAFFNFACSVMGNERQFKLKVYPNIGLAIVFPVFFMFGAFSDFENLTTWRDKMANTSYYLAIYGAIILLSTTIIMLKYSESYKAAWIYKTVPLKDTEAIFKGTFKAMLYKLIIPIFIVESIVFIFIFKIGVIIQLIVVFLNMLLLTIITFRLTDKALPFSISFSEMKGNGGDVAAAFLPMFLVGLFAVIHYGITRIQFGVYVYAAILFLLDMILWKKLFNIPWSKIK